MKSAHGHSQTLNARVFKSMLPNTRSFFGGKKQKFPAQNTGQI